MNGKILIILFVVILLLGWLVLSHPERTPVTTPTHTAIAGEVSTNVRSPVRELRTVALSTDSAPESAPPTNIIASLMKGEAPQLTPAQIETYLEENNRSVESLLGAFRAGGEKKFLQEAQTRFPNDPRVAFASLFKSDSPEERRQWLDHFESSDANNAIPNYLSAHDYFKAGQRDQAMQELLAASGKRGFQDYSMDFLQSAEEAYLSAGYTEGQAKAIAATQLLLPHLAELKQVGVALADFANTSRQAGDEASGLASLQLVVQLGQHLQQPSGWNTVIGELVGAAVERIALNQMDPSSPYGEYGQTVQARLDELTQQRASIRASVQHSDTLMESLSDQDLATFFDREKLFGEIAAIQWARNRVGQKQTPASN